MFFKDRRLKYGLVPLISLLTYNKLINFTLIWLWAVIWLVFGRLLRLEINNLLNKFINYTLWEFIIGYSIVLFKKEEDIYFFKYAGLFLCITLLKCFHYLMEERLGEWKAVAETVAEGGGEGEGENMLQGIDPVGSIASNSSLNSSGHDASEASVAMDFPRQNLAHEILDDNLLLVTNSSSTAADTDTEGVGEIIRRTPPDSNMIPLDGTNVNILEASVADTQNQSLVDKDFGLPQNTILARVGAKKDLILSEIVVQSSRLRLKVSHKIIHYNSLNIGFTSRFENYRLMSTGLASRLESYESIRTGISGRLRVFKSYRLAIGIVLLHLIDLLLVAKLFKGLTNKPNILLGIFGFEILQLYPLIIITSLKFFNINKKVMYITEFIINLSRFLMICFFAAIFLYWYTLPLHILPSSYLSLKILVVKSRNLLNFKKNQIILGKLQIPLDYDYNCIICFDDFDNCQSTRQLACGHIYHFYCIKNWLDYSRKCPICRENV